MPDSDAYVDDDPYPRATGKGIDATASARAFQHMKLRSCTHYEQWSDQWQYD